MSPRPISPLCVPVGRSAARVHQVNAMRQDVSGSSCGCGGEGNSNPVVPLACEV